MRHKLTSGGQLGRHEKDKGFVTYRAGQTIEDVSADWLKKHGHRLEPVPEDEAIPVPSDVVQQCLDSNVQDVRPMIASMTDPVEVNELLEQDTRATVQTLAKRRLSELLEV
jgi:hypothetical protein